ncbi:MAG: recombinase family protein, partial [Planctomycetota bacterium]
LRPNYNLIITDLSRLTRKLTDIPEIMDKLKDNEIHVTSTNLNMGGSIMRAAMRMIRIAEEIAMTECSVCPGRFLRSK